MNRTFYRSLIALAALVWTAAGETSDPLLALTELPPDVVADCRPRPEGNGCDSSLTRHWLGRAAQGELFLVAHAGCTRDCAAWLVQRSAGGMRTLLAITGEFRLARVAGPFPAVQVRHEVSTAAVHYTRYAWNDGDYVPVETRRVYRVDGVECGSAAECDAAARAALAHGNSDRAVRIYEQVHGIGWI